MGKWIARLALLDPEKPANALLHPTVKTAKSPVTSVLTVPYPSDFKGIDSPRPFALSADDADRAHDILWNEATIARCVSRITLFMRRGLSATDADDLAEQRHFRDITFDDRISCIECVSYRPGNTRACGNVQVAGVQECNSITATMLQRCGGFQGAPFPTNLDESEPGIGK